MPVKRKRNLAARVLCLASMLACLVPRSSAIAAGQDTAPQAAGKTVCSLSDEQELAAPKAFAAMMPTFQTPRCINCHGEVNPFTGENHGGGRIEGKLVKEWVEHVDDGLSPPHAWCTLQLGYSIAVSVTFIPPPTEGADGVFQPAPSSSLGRTPFSSASR